MSAKATTKKPSSASSSSSTLGASTASSTTSTRSGITKSTVSSGVKKTSVVSSKSGDVVVNKQSSSGNLKKVVVEKEVTVNENSLSEGIIGEGKEDDFYSLDKMARDVKANNQNETTLSRPVKISPKLIAQKCLKEIPTDEEELYV